MLHRDKVEGVPHRASVARESSRFSSAPTFMCLLGSLFLSWWILVYWLFGLLWYPPWGAPLGRFAILYGLLVLATLPVSVTLVWTGRRLRQQPLKPTLVVAMPALLWIVALVLGTIWMDEVVMSVVAVQVIIAAFFLAVVGVVVALGRRFNRSYLATRVALGALLTAQIACYSIEVWRLTAYAHPAGGRLLEHALFSKWTFIVGLVGTLLSVTMLVLFGKPPSVSTRR